MDPVELRGPAGDTARAWLDAGRPAGAPARPSATVMLLRDADAGATGAGGVEVFMLRRVATMAFAPSVWVFPGGGVDARDADADLPWAGPSRARWASSLGLPATAAAALVVAAAREVYEECGVLLAARGEQVVGEVDAVVGPDDRARLLDRSWSFGEFLAARGLTLRSDLLRPLDRWITPGFEPRRYDTVFFAARLPRGQVPDGATTEAERSAWVRPDDLLRQAADRAAALMPPTRAQLARLGALGRADDINTHTYRLRPTQPAPYLVGDRVWLRLDEEDRR